MESTKPTFTQMQGFTKLFGTILTSTIWREDDKTRIVWITMLALADKYGVVNAAVPGLAAVANVSVAECQSALKKLGEPDSFSRTQDFEGRRIQTIPGGWKLLNYVKYRELGKEVDRNAYQREKQREYRERLQSFTPVDKALPSASASASASEERKEEGVQGKGEGKPAPGPGPKTESLPSNEMQNGHLEKAPKSPGSGPRPENVESAKAYAVEIGLPESEGESFFDHFSSNGWKVGGKTPMKDWKAALRNWKRRKSSWSGSATPSGGPMPNASRGQVGEARERQEEIKGIKIITIGPEGEKIRYT